MPRAGAAPGPEHDLLVAFGTGAAVAIPIVTGVFALIVTLGGEPPVSTWFATFYVGYAFGERVLSALEVADMEIATRSDASV